MNNFLIEKEPLKGKVAIITGGGTGIGKEAAKIIGSLGAKIAICGRRIEPLKQTFEEFQKLNIETIYTQCDTRNYDSVTKFVEFVLEKYKTIDILVNNAGGQFPALAENISPKGFEAVIRNNLIGTWNMTYCVATKSFLEEKKGTILNVVAQVKRGFPGMCHTGAARAGVINLTKSLSIEWAKYGITVNCIAPGVIESSGTTKYSKEMFEMAVKAIPLGRVGNVTECAQLMAYMVLPQSKFITGQTYYIDGGQSLHGDSFKAKL